LFEWASLVLLSLSDCDGNVDSNRSRGKKFLGQIVPGNFGENAAINAFEKKIIQIPVKRSRKV